VKPIIDRISCGKLERVGAAGTLGFAMLLLACLLSSSQAGSESDSKNVASAQQPRPTWYADNEWNVDVFGTYAFTDTKYVNDRYLDADHAWGGGVDIRYFFHRYFGVGIEGYILDATRTGLDAEGIGAPFLPPIQVHHFKEERGVGSVLGAFTLRCPIPSTRFAPYLYAGGGSIFGGGQLDKEEARALPGVAEAVIVSTVHKGSETEAIGQVGGGFEVRLTPHIGIINDFSWNVVNGSHNNFGMVRSGINFAF
jgi:hypothetical protein